MRTFFDTGPVLTVSELLELPERRADAAWSAGASRRTGRPLRRSRASTARSDGRGVPAPRTQRSGEAQELGGREVEKTRGLGGREAGRSPPRVLGVPFGHVDPGFTVRPLAASPSRGLVGGGFGSSFFCRCALPVAGSFSSLSTL